jgi:hypothetical protein
MKLSLALLLQLLIALAGCVARDQVEVRITLSSYSAGAVKSQLATPVVDEVVRLKPRQVLVLLCISAPPAKLAQFDSELYARIKTQGQLKLVTEGCEP